MLSLIVSNALLNPGNTNIKPGLNRMRQVLEKLENPQNKYKVIHITGTNGKGSTAAFLTTGLIHARLRTGKFMSPHIIKINECITINNQEISDTDIERVYFLIAEVVQKYNIEQPSPFEFLTLIMFYYMAENKIAYLVLEAGMGGESDCTNVVDSLYSIITNVGLEHTKWLGNTLDKIATNKAGIIKNGKAIIADNGIELLNAVKRKTSNYVNVLEKYKLHVDLDGENFKTNVSIVLKGHGFPIESGMADSFELGLYGKFQAYNFLIAYELFKDLNISNESIEFAASNTFIPYRFQIMERNPLIIYDITHNLSGAIALSDTLLEKNITSITSYTRDTIHKSHHRLKNRSTIYNKDDVVFISAVLGDKDIYQMLEVFSTLTSNIIFTSIPNNPRALSAVMLHDIAQKTAEAHGFDVADTLGCRYNKTLFKQQYIIDDCIEALQFAKSLHKKMIVVCGSSYIFHNLS